MTKKNTKVAAFQIQISGRKRCLIFVDALFLDVRVHRSLVVKQNFERERLKVSVCLDRYEKETVNGLFASHFLGVSNNFFEGRIQFFCECRVSVYEMIQKHASIRLTTIHDLFLIRNVSQNIRRIYRFLLPLGCKKYSK